MGEYIQPYTGPEPFLRFFFPMQTNVRTTDEDYAMDLLIRAAQAERWKYTVAHWRADGKRRPTHVVLDCWR